MRFPIAIFLLSITAAQAQTRVVDGDTIVLNGERLRLFGLNCPELRDPGGPEAKRAMQSLLAGKTITLKRRELDRYGRTVAKVFADGRDVTTQMIANGHCKEYCKYSKGEYGACDNPRTRRE